jgi:hypothetical protein
MADDTRVTTTGGGIPAYLQRKDKATGEKLQSRGFDEMESKDMILPRLGLCQSMSPQRDKVNPKYVKGLEEGMLFNTLTGAIYDQPLQIVPLFFFKSRIYFKDIKEGGGVLCQAPDGKSCQLNHGGPCLHSAWGAGGEPPECNEFFNYPSLLFPTKELIVVSLKATGLKAGKEWNSLMRLRGADMFAGVYEVTSQPAQNKAGQRYYAFKIRNPAAEAERWSPPEFYQEAEVIYENTQEGMASGRITVAEVEETETESDKAFADRDTEM